MATDKVQKLKGYFLQFITICTFLWAIVFYLMQNGCFHHS